MDRKKFYVRHRGSDRADMRINTGKYDPLLGRSYFEIAMQARSQHRTQEQGVPELKGEQFSAVDLDGGTAKEADIFDGLDTSIKGIATNTANTDENLAARLSRLQTIAAAAYQQYDFRSPEKIVSLLMDGYALSDEAERSTRDPAAKAFLGQKRSEFLAAIKLAAGIQIDAISDAETVVQGEEFPVNVRVFTPSPETVSVKSFSLVTPSGKTFSPIQPPAESDPNPFRREKANYAAYFTASLNDGPAPTQPYWLDSPREGDLFKWQNVPGVTLPFQAPILAARIEMTIDGRPVEMTVPVEYRYTDGVLGELRRDLNVVPGLTVDLDQQLVIVPISKTVQTRRVVVSVVNNSPRRQSGEVALSIDRLSVPGWTSNRKPFSLAGKGDKASLLFEIPIPPNISSGSYTR